MANNETWFNTERTEKANEGVSLQKTFEDAMRLAKSKRDWERFSSNLKARMGNGRMWELMASLKDESNGKPEMGKIDTESKISEVNNAVKTLLSDEMPSWVPTMGSTEYQQLKDKVASIYNNVKLWVPENLMTYSVWTVYDNGNVKILTMQDPIDSSKNVKVTFNKWQNRFSVTKDWNFVSSKAYM